MKSQKRIPQTDAIFENVAQAHQTADMNPEVLRISIDSKAKVKIGNLSRNGKARTLSAKQADDHDDHWDAVLVPFGILDVESAQLSIYFGESAETSDFIVDCLNLWWQQQQAKYPGVQELWIDLDGGSAIRSNRTQFIKRLVQFVQATRLRVRLLYYPPYHSKYNPIERCWAALEHYWNGTILNTIDDALRWAANMTWKGISPLVHFVQGSYPKKIAVPKDELAHYERQWQRSEALPKWDVSIVPI
ncbi:MAG: transposase [Cyanobacteria bacterium]|nr:transposase [Cyanobacteriota bacterium]